MSAYRLADRLHRLPSEILTITADELTHFIAYTRIEERERQQ